MNITPHKTLNSSKGVVRHPEFRYCTEEEMVDELVDQNVTHARRILTRREGQLVPTNTFILTFGLPTLPPKIKVGFMSILVQPFIPNPMRCFKCQQYGHHKDNCKGKDVCARCSQAGHSDTGCENPPHCVNCKGDHCAYAKGCPRWQEERDIQKIKTINKVSYYEAKRLVDESRPKKGLSYASAVKTQTGSTSVECQVDDTMLSINISNNTTCITCKNKLAEKPKIDKPIIKPVAVATTVVAKAATPVVASAATHAGVAKAPGAVGRVGGESTSSRPRTGLGRGNPPVLTREQKGSVALRKRGQEEDMESVSSSNKRPSSPNTPPKAKAKIKKNVMVTLSPIKFKPKT